jgi:hypothetical protein
MYADVSVAGAAAQPMPVIPRSAVQNIGEQTVVYLANSNDPGKFVEREVRLGAVAGDVAEVVSGVVPGDVIVREGSFFIRAERDRLGLRTPAGTGSQATVQTAKIVVSEKGFEPGTITLRAGAPARLTFVRTSDKTCATEVVFPSLKIKRALPLNEAVTIEFTPEKSEMTFTCGMNMLKGTLLVK